MLINCMGLKGLKSLENVLNFLSFSPQEPCFIGSGGLLASTVFWGDLLYASKYSWNLLSE